MVITAQIDLVCPCALQARTQFLSAVSKRVQRRRRCTRFETAPGQLPAPDGTGSHICVTAWTHVLVNKPPSEIALLILSCSLDGVTRPGSTSASHLHNLHGWFDNLDWHLIQIRLPAALLGTYHPPVLGIKVSLPLLGPSAANWGRRPCCSCSCNRRDTPSNTIPEFTGNFIVDVAPHTICCILTLSLNWVRSPRRICPLFYFHTEYFLCKYTIIWTSS